MHIINLIISFVFIIIGFWIQMKGTEKYYKLKALKQYHKAETEFVLYTLTSISFASLGAFKIAEIIVMLY